MALTFALVEPAATAVSGNLSAAALGANAEISAYNKSSGYLYTVGGGSGAILVSDLTNPSNPKIVAKANATDSAQTLQSAATFGRLLAVAVQNGIKTQPGFVQFYDLTNPTLPSHISTVSVGALPDMVKFSHDGSKLLVTNEGEPSSDYSIDPSGSISVIHTAAYLTPSSGGPTQADVATVDFSAWNNRKAELINRGIRITGKSGVTNTVAQDIEPEAIAITTDGNTAYISLQENNAIAVLDISTATPKITSLFSAGIKDWDRGQASATNISYTLSYAAGDANTPTGVQAGGLSGLFFDGTETVGETSLDIYYSVTDRGPNGALIAGKRQFLDPDFQPTVYKLGMNRANGAITELAKIGLKRTDGTALTGLPQLAGKDDIPIDSTNQNLSYDPFGIDSETISVFHTTIGGESRKVFAIGDEYRGQIALFDFNTGNLIQRYIPAGQKALLQAQHGSVIGAETIDSLPGVYANRWSNRGIEGMAFNSKDGLLYAFMQSPLDVDSNGDGVVAERSLSQLTRILAIDPATGTPVKEHLYLLSGRSGQDKIGDVTYDAARNVFLVMERDSTRARNGFKSVYEVDLRGATNTLPLTLGNQVSEAALPAQTFLVGTEGRAVFREVLDAGELGNNGYRFNGIPDGIGVMDNGDGTLRVLVNHELGATAGDQRAHGSKGAYVSDLTIDKATLSVISGKDFLASANDLFLANADGSSWSSGITTAFSRFCSGDLAAATAFRNGSTGYDGRIYLTGEESNPEGRAFAHVLSGSDAGKVYELPSLGNLSFENVVANPLAQTKTVVVSLDDTITNGQVYIYVGTKSTSGNAVEQAGLAGGITYGVRVNSTGSTNTEVGNLANANETNLGLNANGVGTFELVNLGDVKAKTGATINTESINAGVTNWLRPEDGAWSKDGKTFYFVTTATVTSASRLWALEFTDPANPEQGGTVKMLLNGSEGQVMLDNMTVADDGSILLQEDPGNTTRLAKIWRYNPSSDTLVELAQHNPALFSGTVSGTGNITLDEESSGIVDISSFLTGVSGYDTSKYSYFLIADQIHKAVSTPTSQVEMGELGIMATAKASSSGVASWADAIGVINPELLDNSRTLVDGVYSISSADRLATAGIQLVNKVELFNLPSVGGSLSYDKPEGLTIRDDGALVINYDNDFGIEGASGNAFTIINFSNPGLDTEDSGDGGGYKPANNHDVYGLVMPDGLATLTYNGETFILAAGEGDDRNDWLNPDETARVSSLLTAATNAGASNAQKAGLLASNALRLNILTNTGDLDRDGIIDQAYTLGSRSLRIYDSKGNVVFDSDTALEELAAINGLYPNNSREDDKGVEPEMVEVATVNGRTYAFVTLERTSTSMAAIFDVTNPYEPSAVSPLIFPGAQRVEGITFLTKDANRMAIASSEGNDIVSIKALPIPDISGTVSAITVQAGGTAQEGATLVAGSISGDPDGVSSIISHQWLRDGIPITGATQSSYTTPTTGHGNYRVAITYSDGQGYTSTIASDEINVLKFNNGNASISAITAQAGAAFQEGVILLAGELSDDPDGNGAITSYQWLHNGIALTGATNASLNTSATGYGLYQVAITSIDGQEYTSTVLSNAQDVAVNPALKHAPTDIKISTSTFDENMTGYGAIATLATIDPDQGNSFSYSLVSGEGDNDNSSFRILGNQLRVATRFNYENQSLYSIRLRSRDQSGLAIEKSFSLNINDINEKPTDIQASSTSFAETTATGTSIANLITIDPDGNESFNYELISGAGDSDNGAFLISDNKLILNTPVDYESKAVYTIRVRVTDHANLSMEKRLIFRVEDANEAPTNIQLTSQTFNENTHIGSTVSLLRSADPDKLNNFTYTLVSGEGDSDNASFSINGNKLELQAGADYETKRFYSIRLRSTDQGGLYTEVSARLDVKNIIETVSSSSSTILPNDKDSIILFGNNNATATGNQSDNSITGNLGSNIISGGLGKDTLTGRGGTDRFTYNSRSESALDGYDVITDYAIDDVIVASWLTANTSLTSLSGNLNNLDPTSISSLLNSGNFQADQIAGFTVQGISGCFLAFNDHQVGFQAASDSIIHLQNFSPTNASPIQIAVV
jgi:Esterase-like activity of phytase/Cadherin domain